MPYIEGETLRALIERERQLSLDRALAITRDVAEALQYAHTQNIVHRDIKPENILIERESGRAVVTDFGIARAIERAADITTVTSTGLTLGTPTYMSPEQAGAEKEIDGRSDIYSLGCALYEMLAGVPPFNGPTARAIIARHMTEPPPSIRIVRPDLEKGVEALLVRMLAKVPAGRPRDAAKLLDAIDHYPELKLPPARRPHPAWWLALLLVIGMVAVWLLGRASVALAPGPSHDPTRVAVLPFAAPTNPTDLNEVATAISADLISALRTGDLRVISEAGIARFAPNAAPRDVARELDVGTLVYGRLEPVGSSDSLRLRVRLVDDSAVERESFDIYSPRGTTLALRDSVVQRVARRLVGRLGREVQLKQWRTRTTSDEAWLLRARAQSLIERGRGADLIGAHEAARAAYQAADSLLIRAGQADPAWSEPSLGRAQVSWNRSRSSDVARRGQFLDEALAHVAEALAREPRSAGALAMRGQIRFDKWQWGVAGASLSSRDSAAADLRLALSMDSTLAPAWNVYSAILQAEGDRAGAVAAARRAIRADSYQRDIVPSMNRLIIAELAAERNDSARVLCAQGVERFPGDRVMRQCVLNVLGYSGAGDEDIKRAWAALALEERDGIYATVNGVWPPGRFFVAAVLARSGRRDSARAVITATRATLRAAGEPTTGATHEAFVWTILGQRDTAITLLEAVVRSHPAERATLGQLPWFKSLKTDARFARLLAGN